MIMHQNQFFDLLPSQQRFGARLLRLVFVSSSNAVHLTKFSGWRPFLTWTSMLCLDQLPSLGVAIWREMQLDGTIFREATSRTRAQD